MWNPYLTLIGLENSPKHLEVSNLGHSRLLVLIMNTYTEVSNLGRIRLLIIYTIEVSNLGQIRLDFGILGLLFLNCPIKASENAGISC